MRPSILPTLLQAAQKNIKKSSEDISFFEVGPIFIGDNPEEQINTITGMAIDIESRRPVLGNISGGLSGPAIKPIALQQVMQVYEIAGPQNIPIMGQGGISSINDAIEFLIAGASTIGIGTALFIDPLICNKINTGLEKYLADHSIDGIGALTGSLIKD